MDPGGRIVPRLRRRQAVCAADAPHVQDRRTSLQLLGLQARGVGPRCAGSALCGRPVYPAAAVHVTGCLVNTRLRHSRLLAWRLCSSRECGRCYGVLTTTAFVLVRCLCDGAQDQTKAVPASGTWPQQPASSRLLSTADVKRQA